MFILIKLFVFSDEVVMKFYKIVVHVCIAAWLLSSTSYAMDQKNIIAVDFFGLKIEFNCWFFPDNSVDMIYFDQQAEDVPLIQPVPEHEHNQQTPIIDLGAGQGAQAQVFQERAPNTPSSPREEILTLRLEGEPMPERLMPLLTQVLLKKAKEHFMKNPGDAFYVEDILQKNGVTTCYVVRE